MNLISLLRGLAVGLSIAAPVGPVGLLCIRRTLAKGRTYGFASGLGAATAHALYGAVAGFGMMYVSDALAGKAEWLRIAGGLFLCALGAWIMSADPARGTAAPSGRDLAGAHASTFALALLSPATILTVAAVWAGFGITGAAAGPSAAVLMVLGVFLGSALWWLLLCGIVGFFRERFADRWIVRINRASGAAIAGFGLLLLLR